MITRDTLAHRQLVCEVFKEVTDFLDGKSRELTAKLDGFDTPEATREQLNDYMHTAELALSYASISSKRPKTFWLIC